VCIGSEWGSSPEVTRPLGDEITPLGFRAFAFRGAEVTIPADAWDIDAESPPAIPPGELEGMRRRGEEILERQTRFIVEFAGAFQNVDLARALGGPASGGSPPGV